MAKHQKQVQDFYLLFYSVMLLSVLTEYSAVEEMHLCKEAKYSMGGKSVKYG